MTDLAAYRLRNLVRQSGLSRAAAAALLRALADELEPAAIDGHLRAAAENEALRLRMEGITVTVCLEVRTLGAATILGRAPKTLRNWRACGVGPQWRSDGGVVWYSLVDLIAWRRGDVSRPVPTITVAGMR